MNHIYRIFTEQMAATNYFQLIISIQFCLLFKRKSNLKSLYIQPCLSVTGPWRQLKHLSLKTVTSLYPQVKFS